MTRATVTSSGGILLSEVTYTYDVFDRRIAKTVDADGEGPGLAETTYTAYNGDNAWADFDAAGNVIARYLFGNNIDQILARFRPGEGTAWYLTDHLGSIRDIVNSLGALIDTITYDSFGNIINETNAAAGDRFKFTGREWDPELALYYYRARFYDPAIGRFVSQDPLGFGAGDANLYRYVGNSPLMYTDPLGQFAWLSGFFAKHGKKIAGAIGGGLVGYACGYLIAKSHGDPNPHQSALFEMAVGSAIGFVVGRVFPVRFQLFVAVSGAVSIALLSDSWEDVLIEAGCIAAEIVASGGAQSLTKFLLKGRNRRALAAAIRRLIKDEAGSLDLELLLNRIRSLEIPYNKENFRDNLRKLWNMALAPEAYDAHHMFPQKWAKEFYDRFGIDVHDPAFGTWWELNDHRQLAKEYNDLWNDFLKGDPSVDDVFKFAQDLAEDFGLDWY